MEWKTEHWASSGTPQFLALLKAAQLEEQISSQNRFIIKIYKNEIKIINERPSRIQY